MTAFVQPQNPRLRRKRPPTPRVGLHVEITQLLQGRSLTAVDLAAMLSKDLPGVESSLRGMERRREVVRSVRKPGAWATWALRGGV